MPQTTLPGTRFILYCRKSSESEDRQQLSLVAQETEARRIADSRGLTIVGEPLIESMSAKRPGRPKFNEMLRRIRAGDADGILCWHLDRLARNPRDGGDVMQELLEGNLTVIVTASGDYDGEGHDALMMSILFGMASQYSRTLSTNIRRGNRAALEAGRWPGMAPLGYVRNPATRELEPDPERFDLVQRMWDLRLQGVPVSEIVDQARDEWGLTTPANGRRGGGPLPKSTGYRVLSDPFYTGLMRRKEGEFIGNHKPMLSLAQFESLEAPQRTVTKAPFLYNGLICCGTCGAVVTAERKTNRHGTTYTYYHCARKSRRYGYCPERSVTEEYLTEAFGAFIATLHVPQDVFAFAVERLRDADRDAAARRAADRHARAAELGKIQQRLVALRQHLVAGVLDEQEYLEDRDTLRARQLALQQADEVEEEGLIEPLVEAHSYVNLAKSAFANADREERREIIRKVSSHPTLKTKKLRCLAKFPFDELAKIRQIPGE